MPTFQNHDATIYYEVHGSGFPVLLFAPGGLLSQIAYWQDAINGLAQHFQVVALDQRNATPRSTAPIRTDDSWHVYTSDHLALLDHLGIRKCHVMGMCIGPSFALALMKLAPDRVAAAAFWQPIGLAPENAEEEIPAPDNLQLFYESFNEWAAQRARDVDPAVLAAFRARLYEAGFVFSVSEADVAAMPHPMLVLMGTDRHHPSFTSRRLCSVARNAVLVEEWKTPEALPAAFGKVCELFLAHASA